MKYLGIDYGDKRIGIALSDPEAHIAFPQETLENHGENKVIQHIAAFIKKEHITCIVLGLPVSFNGGDSEQTKKVRQFGSVLEKKVDIPVVFENEMLTTHLARSEGVAKKHVDASAAALILQSHLDRLKSEARNSKF